MSKRLVISEYKIPKVSMDFEKLPSGESSIEIETSVNMMIPKDLTDRRCILDIKAEFNTNENGTILSALIRAFIDISDNISQEEKTNLIKAEAFPVVYNELRSFIENLLDNAHIKFFTLPPFDALSP